MLENLYDLSYRYKTNGFSGPNPLTMSDIRMMIDDVGKLDWWQIEFLFLIDNLVQSHNSEMMEK